MKYQNLELQIASRILTCINSCRLVNTFFPFQPIQIFGMLSNIYKTRYEISLPNVFAFPSFQSSIALKTDFQSNKNSFHQKLNCFVNDLEDLAHKFHTYPTKKDTEIEELYDLEGKSSYFFIIIEERII